MRRRALILVTMSLLSPLLWYAYMATMNNMDSQIDRDELRTALVKSIDWLEQHKANIFEQDNTAMWWMMMHASQTTDEPRLRDFFTEYEHKVLNWRPNGYWTGFTDPEYRRDLPHSTKIQEAHDFELFEYQLFFLYGLYCDQELGEEEIIRKQLSSDYCPSALRAPACVTHQIMGLLLLEWRGCETHTDLSDTLLDSIESNLFWEFRTGDSYIQRVLMLVASGRSVDSGWVRAILDAQNADGGWDDVHPLISMGPLQLGLTSRWPTLHAGKSSFHATSQAIWLLVLLLEQSR